MYLISFFSILNAAGDKGKGKKCLSPLENSDSGISDEEDNKRPHTPKRQTKFPPPKFSKNQSMGTPAKDPRNRVRAIGISKNKKKYFQQSYKHKISS